MAQVSICKIAAKPAGLVKGTLRVVGSSMLEEVPGLASSGALFFSLFLLPPIFAFLPSLSREESKFELKAIIIFIIILLREWFLLRRAYCLTKRAANEDGREQP